MSENWVIVLVSVFGVYVLSSTIGFIWWMATITEQLKTLKELVKNMNDHNNEYARKTDVARELGVIEKNQETMWTKFEKLKEKVDTQQSKGAV